MDDLSDDHLGNAAGVMRAGVAVPAEVGAQLAGHDAVWGFGCLFPLVAVDGPCEGGDRDDPAAQYRVEVLARPPG